MSALELEVHEGDAPPECVALRTAVFVREQGVSERHELDGLDPECVHFLARREGAPVGCARLRPTGRREAKVERVAVLPELRDAGLGRLLMDAVEAEAQRRGWRELVLHAQLPVVGFYHRLGWKAEGKTFWEAGIEHRAMRKQLEP